jgi:hypothetical protein
MSSLKHIKHEDLDPEKWDRAILSSKIPTVFAQFFYLDATSPGWEALVIGDYESVFPLTWKMKFGYIYLPQPYFTGQLGAFGKIDLEIENLFYDFIIKRYKLIELELNAGNKLESQYTAPKNTFVIEYEKGFNFNQNTRRNIAKAHASYFKVEEASTEEVIPLSGKYLDPFLRKNLGLSDGVVVLFNSLLKACIAHRSVHTFKVTDPNGSVKALGHFVFNKKYAVFLKGTNLDKADNSGSMHLLISHAISFFENKCACFDFGGGSLNEGLAGFYRGLGGTKLDYHFLRINNLPKVLKLFKK